MLEEAISDVIKVIDVTIERETTSRLTRTHNESDTCSMLVSIEGEFENERVSHAEQPFT